DDLAHCVQGKGTVYQFIQKLETMASELHDLGSPVPYRDLKLRLHKGLKSMLLRQRLDVDLMNDQMSFEQFRDGVLLHHKQLINYYGVDYEIKGPMTSIATQPRTTESYRSGSYRPRDRSSDSRRERDRRVKDYTPTSATSQDHHVTERRPSVNSLCDNYDEDSQDDYSLRHLLAIRND
ncbi:hypothetical protein FOZ62_019139, partial [Perkinsus olseni]